MERVIGRQIRRRSRQGGHGGFHGSIPLLLHATVLGDDRGNGDLVASVSVHEIEKGVLFFSMSVQVRLETSDTIRQEMVMMHKHEGLQSLGERKLNQVMHFRFFNQT